jgi:predicted ABC-type ATPase
MAVVLPPAQEGVRVFIRKKTVKGHEYYHLIEGYRDPDGRVRHRVIVSLHKHKTVGAAIRSCKARLRAAVRQHERWESDFPLSSPRSPWVLKEIAAAGNRVALLQAWLSRLDEAKARLAQRK